MRGESIPKLPAYPSRITLPKGRFLDLSQGPLVMGILNCSPDSFHSGSRVSDPGMARERGLEMAEAGAAILDLGGESTRPGSDYVSADEELERILPALKALRAVSDLPISIDSRKAAVAAAALSEGADIVNDISALEDDPQMAQLIVNSGAAVVLMHKRGEPKTMQESPSYTHVVSEIRDYLLARAQAARSLGIDGERIILDPGFGFGKRYEDNFDILAHLAEISQEGYPVLIGLSRKSFLGRATGRDVADRLAATTSAHTLALLGGAAILRAHDVAQAVDAVRVVQALLSRP